MIFTFKVQSQEIGKISAKEGYIKQIGEDARLITTLREESITLTTINQLLFLQPRIDESKALEYLIHNTPWVLFDLLRKRQQISFESILNTLYSKPMTCFIVLIHILSICAIPITINNIYTGHVQSMSIASESGACEILLVQGHSEPER